MSADLKPLFFINRLSLNYFLQRADDPMASLGTTLFISGQPGDEPLCSLTAAQAQIARLEAERDALREEQINLAATDDVTHATTFDRLARERDAALARVAVLEKDAARYRALRRGAKWSVIDWKGDDLRADALDAAIDAATSPATQEPPAGAEGVL